MVTEVPPTMIHLQNRLDEVRGYEAIRQLRWPDRVCCPHGGGVEITRQGRDTTPPARQKYRCPGGLRSFDDRTGTVLAGHHPPLRVWMLCLYFMGLNRSNAPIARESGLNPNAVPRRTEPLREGIVARQPEPVLSGEVEGDEGYGVAGHNGHPDAGKEKAAEGGGGGGKGREVGEPWRRKNRRFSG